MSHGPLTGDDITKIEKPHATPVLQKAETKTVNENKSIKQPADTSAEVTAKPTVADTPAEAVATPAEEPPAVASEEEMSLEFEMPGDDTPAEIKKKDDRAKCGTPNIISPRNS